MEPTMSSYCLINKKTKELISTHSRFSDAIAELKKQSPNSLEIVETRGPSLI